MRICTKVLQPSIIQAKISFIKGCGSGSKLTGSRSDPRKKWTRIRPSTNITLSTRWKWTSAIWLLQGICLHQFSYGTPGAKYVFCTRMGMVVIVSKLTWTLPRSWWVSLPVVAPHVSWPHHHLIQTPITDMLLWFALWPCGMPWAWVVENCVLRTAGSFWNYADPLTSLGKPQETFLH